MDDEKKEILLRKCKLTSSNYGNLANKLQKRKKFFEVMLPYYSIIGIINTLIPKYFETIPETQKNALSFWGIFISISFLVISMQISLAHYPEKIDTATKTLNNLKIIISEIQTANNCDLKKISDKYEQLTYENQLVRRRYFYTSCKEYDRINNLNHDKAKSEKLKHFSLPERIYIVTTNIMENFLYLLIFCLPLLVYAYIFKLP